MGSLFLLLFIGFVLAILIWIVIKVPWWAKPLIIIGAFLAVMEKMCQEQGGLHIYKTVDNVEGVEIMYGYPDIFMIKDYDYSFVEGWGERLEQQQNGTVLKRENVIPKSMYQIAYLTNSNFNKYYYEFSAKIFNRKSKNVLASYNSYGYTQNKL